MSQEEDKDNVVQIHSIHSRFSIIALSAVHQSHNFEKQKALQENAAVTSQKKYHWQFVPVFSTSVPYLPRTVLLVIIHALSDPNRTPDLSNRIYKTLFRSDGHRSV